MARTKAFDPDIALSKAMDVFWQKGYTATDRKSTRLNSSHSQQARMPSSALKKKLACVRCHTVQSNSTCGRSPTEP